MGPRVISFPSVGDVAAMVCVLAAFAVIVYGVYERLTSDRPARVFRTRASECQRSCELLSVQYVDTTEYGCFCSEDGSTFIIGPESWGADD